jgi:hypothetical protein
LFEGLEFYLEHPEINDELIEHVIRYYMISDNFQILGQGLKSINIAEFDDKKNDVIDSYLRYYLLNPYSSIKIY